jgi:hypothetical protein
MSDPQFIVQTKGGHTIKLSEVDFTVDSPLPWRGWSLPNAPSQPDKVKVSVILEFENKPEMDGSKFIAGILRGLESIE